MSCFNNFPPMPNTCKKIRKLFQVLHKQLTGSNLRDSPTFNKIVDYLKSSETSSRKLGISLAKSQFKLDPYDLCHRIKKEGLYLDRHDSFVYTLSVVEFLHSGGFVIYEIIDAPPCYETSFMLLSARSVYHVDTKKELAIPRPVAENIVNIIENSDGDFYESFLLNYQW